MSKTKSILKIIILLILINPILVFASEYVCSIKSILRLSDVGLYVTHGWAANYMNRRFFVDRETGKVIGTTALKARLTNFNRTYSPTILHNAQERTSYKVLTVFEDKGQFSYLRIDENVASDEKPYSYQTSVGMHFTGTCIERESKK